MSRWAPSPASREAIKFRHSFWCAKRERVRRALVDAGTPLARRFNYQECGGSAMVWVDKNKRRAKVTARCCHDRWCEACGIERRRRLAVAIMGALPNGEARHVVLTLASSHRPLREQFDHLIGSFNKLRRSNWWINRVAGGVWCFELTWSDETTSWHPHLHLLCHCSYLPVTELSAAWKKASKTSHRVHVSLVEQNHSAVREVSKYVGKLIHRTWSERHELIVCAMKALSGRRLYNTFGTWRGIELNAAPAPDPDAKWEFWGTLEALYERARDRDPEALEIIAQIHGKEPSNTRQRNYARGERSPPDSASTV